MRQDNSLTLEQVFVLYGQTLYIEGKSHYTIERFYCKHITNFAKFVGASIPINQISTNLLRNFLSELASGRITNHPGGPARNHAYHRTFRAFFNWMVREGYLEKSPMTNIRPPKLPKMMIVVFANEDIATLLRCCNGRSFIDVRNKAIVLVLLDSGLRESEFLAMKPEDIEMDNGEIKVWGKGSKERVVRIGSKARKALLRYWSVRGSEKGALWLSADGKPITDSGLYKVFQRLGKAAGIHSVRCSPHTCRHTWATRLLDGGANIRDLQTLGGWATLEMVLRYAQKRDSAVALRAHEKYSPMDRLLR